MRTACFLVAVGNCISAKQERDAPKAGQTDNGVYQAAEQGAGTSKQPGHQVESENSHKAPVQTANNRHNERDGIHSRNLHFTLRMGIGCAGCRNLSTDNCKKNIFPL